MEGYASFKCFDCQQKFSSKIDMFEHKKKMHGGYQCPYCTFTAGTAIQILSPHIQRCHSSRYLDTPISAIVPTASGLKRGSTSEDEKAEGTSKRSRSEDKEGKKTRSVSSSVVRRSSSASVEKKSVSKTSSRKGAPKSSVFKTPMPKVIGSADGLSNPTLRKSPTVLPVADNVGVDDIGQEPDIEICCPNSAFPEPPSVNRVIADNLVDTQKLLSPLAPGVTFGSPIKIQSSISVEIKTPESVAKQQASEVLADKNIVDDVVPEVAPEVAPTVEMGYLFSVTTQTGSKGSDLDTSSTQTESPMRVREMSSSSQTGSSSVSVVACQTDSYQSHSQTQVECMHGRVEPYTPSRPLVARTSAEDPSVGSTTGVALPVQHKHTTRVIRHKDGSTEEVTESEWFFVSSEYPCCKKDTKQN